MARCFFVSLSIDAEQKMAKDLPSRSRSCEVQCQVAILLILLVIACTRLVILLGIPSTSRLQLVVVY